MSHPTEAPRTASARTRMIRKAITDAGYAASVTSTPPSHRAQQTTVHTSDQLDAVAVYLQGYLQDLASVSAHGTFAMVNWSERVA